MDDTTFIYALCEPGTRTVRYIGKSNNPKKRLRNHITDSSKRETLLGQWLRSLSREPSLNVLREVPEELWQEAEERYIRLARGLGMTLVNSNGGGGGVSEHCAKTREKISAALLLRGPLSLKHRANLGAAKLGKKHSAKHRAANRASKLGKKHSSERCANNRAAQRSPEIRAKKSNSQSSSMFTHHQFRRMPNFSDGGGI